MEPSFATGIVRSKAIAETGVGEPAGQSPPCRSWPWSRVLNGTRRSELAEDVRGRSKVMNATASAEVPADRPTGAGRRTRPTAAFVSRVW